MTQENISNKMDDKSIFFTRPLSRGGGSPSSRQMKARPDTQSTKPPEMKVCASVTLRPSTAHSQSLKYTSRFDEVTKQISAHLMSVGSKDASPSDGIRRQSKYCLISNKTNLPNSVFTSNQRSKTWNSKSHPVVARPPSGQASVATRSPVTSEDQKSAVGIFSDGHRSPKDPLSEGDFREFFHEKAMAIRPVSSPYNFMKTERYLLERLHAMCRERRAISATSRRSCTHYSAGNNSSISDNHLPQPANQNANLAPKRNSSSLKKSLEKFRKQAYQVIYLRRVMEAIIYNCSTSTLRSAMELQWMHVYAEKHDVTLAFNKHLYSRDRVSTHVPDWAQFVLDLSPEERTEQHCRRLHALLRGLKSFDKFTCEIQLSLCRAFNLARLAEGRVVLKSGHVGVNFYLIYSGSVFVNTEDTTREGRKFMRTVAVLTRGESFGELALLQDIGRTATVSVREKCELLVVNKNVFASVCPRIFERELAEKYTFLNTLDLFSAKFWSPESVRYLAMNAQIQEYKMNKVIVADSISDEWIYICKQGKCQVVRCLRLGKPVQDMDPHREASHTILSEEILELLSSAVVQQHSEESYQVGDMRRNLLTSLGLDYVQTGKKLYPLNSDQTRKSMASVSETMTLTSFIKNKDGEFVILSLGVLEAGQIFDLPSLLDESSDHESVNTLMLVSGGAKVVRVKKAAFFDQASQQAMDNTRTLASKHRNPSDDMILKSYKCKLAWDEFKSDLVYGVLKNKEQHYQSLYRTSAKLADGNPSSLYRKTEKASRRKIISALQSNHVTKEKTAGYLWSSEEDLSDLQMSDDLYSNTGSTRSVMYVRRRSICLDDIEPVCQNERIIIRRHLSNKRTSRQSGSLLRTFGHVKRPLTYQKNIQGSENLALRVNSAIDF